MKTKNLTYPEAVDSGYPFRRAGQDTWNPPGGHQIVKREFALAEDFEIKVEPEKPKEYKDVTYMEDITGLPLNIKNNPATLIEKKEGWVIVSEEWLKVAISEALRSTIVFDQDEWWFIHDKIFEARGYKNEQET